jgi:Putative prokaryotic signal transducing protein
MSEPDEKNKPRDDRADLVEAARVNGPFEADVIKSFLEGHGIASIIRGRTAPFVYPFTVDGLAEFKVMVQQEDLEKARELISAMPTPDAEEGPEGTA